MLSGDVDSLALATDGNKEDQDNLAPPVRDNEDTLAPSAAADDDVDSLDDDGDNLALLAADNLNRDGDSLAPAAETTRRMSTALPHRSGTMRTPSPLGHGR